MRRALLFLSSFIFGVWIAGFAAFISLLVANAPNVPATPFAGISIQTEQSAIALPNRIFACTETTQQFQCQTKIQNQILNLDLIKGKDYKYAFISCNASYGSRTVGCESKGQTYAPILANSYDITGLKLSPQQAAAVAQKYWGMNVLTKLGELRLMWIANGLSIASGLSAIFLTWLLPNQFSKSFATFVCGFGVYRWAVGLLGSVPYETLTRYGIASNNWDWGYQVIAIAAGFLGSLTTAFLLWNTPRPLTKPLVVISGAGIFSLCWLAMSWGCSSLPALFGFNNVFAQGGYVLIALSTGISMLFAGAAAVLLWLHTTKSIKQFLYLSSSLGAIALVSNFLLVLLLGLGYAD